MGHIQALQSLASDASLGPFAKLAGPTTMREKRWTRLFIAGKSADEAAG